MSILMLLIACGDETGVKEIPNSLPDAQIQSHSDGTSFQEGYEVQFYAQVSDQNHENEELQVAWFIDENLVCDWHTPDPSGVTRCDTVLELGGELVSVQVVDPDQGAGRDEISITVEPTEAPTASILSPNVDGSYYSDQLIAFQGVVADAEEALEDLSIVWSSSLDGELALDTSPSTSGEIESFGNLTAGQHAIQLTVTDTTGKSTVESVVVEVSGPNNEPLCSITAPDSGSASVVGQNISFAGTATDEDINNGLLVISWVSDQDGAFNTTAANTAGELEFIYNGLSNGNHTITLTVEDEIGAFCSDTVQVAVGTAPTLTLTTPTTGEIYSVGEAVMFSGTVSDQEDIASDILLSWESDIDGVFSTQGSDTSGSLSFSTSALSVGLHNLIVTATDTTGLTASTSMTLRINTPPEPPSLTISPDPAGHWCINKTAY